MEYVAATILAAPPLVNSPHPCVFCFVTTFFLLEVNIGHTGVCGDGLCNKEFESCSNCMLDCGTCGMSSLPSYSLLYC